jgi:hypothetical protein
MSKRSAWLVGVLVLMVMAGSAIIGAFSGLASTAHANGESNLFLPLICRPFQCGDDPIPPGGACPSECAYCVDGNCVIECISNSCRDSTINCPPGFSCEVMCENESCKNSNIICPDLYTCQVYCVGGSWGCENLTIDCSAEGMCSLDCEGIACSDTLLNCGNDVCVASCLDLGSCTPIVDCGDSCSCSSP